MYSYRLKIFHRTTKQTNKSKEEHILNIPLEKHNIQDYFPNQA